MLPTMRSTTSATTPTTGQLVVRRVLTSPVASGWSGSTSTVDSDISISIRETRLDQNLVLTGLFLVSDVPLVARAALVRAHRLAVTLFRALDLRLRLFASGVRLLRSTISG